MHWNVSIPFFSQEGGGILADTLVIIDEISFTIAICEDEDRRLTYARICLNMGQANQNCQGASPTC